MWRELTAIIILAGTTQAQDRAAQQFSVYVPPRISVGVEDLEETTSPSWTVESTNASGLGLLVEQKSSSQKAHVRWKSPNHTSQLVEGGELIIVQSTGRSKIVLDDVSLKEPLTLTITFLAP